MSKSAGLISDRAAPGARHGNHGKVIRRQGGFTWRGVPLVTYKPMTNGWRGIARRELSGKHGESQAFHVRYFEIAPAAPCYICE